MSFLDLSTRQSATLSSATRHEIFRKLGCLRRMEYLNTVFPLPPLLYVGYSVKLKNVVFVYECVTQGSSIVLYT